MKKCRICEQLKNEDEFYLRSARCKQCILRLNRDKVVGKRKPIINLDGEIWNQINEHPSYLISNYGRVKSLNRQILLKQNFANGYLRVELDGIAYSVHRLVGIAFILNPESKPSINHKNGIKTDNRDVNLEWCTQSENIKHSFKIGLQNNKGENHPRSILTFEKVKEIRHLLRTSNLNQREIAKMFSVSEHTISKIKKRKLWNYKTSQSI